MNIGTPTTALPSVAVTAVFGGFAGVSCFMDTSSSASCVGFKKVGLTITQTQPTPAPLADAAVSEIALAAIDGDTAIACYILGGTAGTECKAMQKGLGNVNIPTALTVSLATVVNLYPARVASKLRVAKMSTTRVIACFQGCPNDSICGASQEAVCKLITYISQSSPLATGSSSVSVDTAVPTAIAVAAYSGSTAVVCVSSVAKTSCRAVRRISVSPYLAPAVALLVQQASGLGKLVIGSFTNTMAILCYVDTTPHTRCSTLGLNLATNALTKAAPVTVHALAGSELAIGVKTENEAVMCALVSSEYVCTPIGLVGTLLASSASTVVASAGAEPTFASIQADACSQLVCFKHGVHFAYQCVATGGFLEAADGFRCSYSLDDYECSSVTCSNSTWQGTGYCVAPSPVPAPYPVVYGAGVANVSSYIPNPCSLLRPSYCTAKVGGSTGTCAALCASTDPVTGPVRGEWCLPSRSFLTNAC